MKPPAPQEIDAAKTPAGGWTKAQLAEWGVPWPPPKGWRVKLIAASQPPASTRKERGEHG